MGQHSHTSAPKHGMENDRILRERFNNILNSPIFRTSTQKFSSALFLQTFLGWGESSSFWPKGGHHQPISSHNSPDAEEAGTSSCVLPSHHPTPPWSPVMHSRMGVAWLAPPPHARFMLQKPPTCSSLDDRVCRCVVIPRMFYFGLRKCI